MSKENTEKVAISAYLPAELRKQVEQNAKLLGQPISVWVERACVARLEATKRVEAC